MIRVPYIQVQLVYRHHRPEQFHAMIDTGSDVTLISKDCYPAQYWKDLKKPIQILVASGQTSQLTKAAFGQFIGIYDDSTKSHKVLPLPTVVLQAPPDVSYNILLGIDFLKRFKEYCSDQTQIKFLTPCGHWVHSPIIHRPTLRQQLTFHPRSQHGDIPYIPKKIRRNKRKKINAIV